MIKKHDVLPGGWVVGTHLDNQIQDENHPGGCGGCGHYVWARRYSRIVAHWMPTAPALRALERFVLFVRQQLELQDGTSHLA